MTLFTICSRCGHELGNHSPDYGPCLKECACPHWTARIEEEGKMPHKTQPPDEAVAAAAEPSEAAIERARPIDIEIEECLCTERDRYTCQVHVQIALVLDRYAAEQVAKERETWRTRTHEIQAEESQRRSSDQAEADKWKAHMKAVTDEIGVIGHSWKCRSIAAKYRDALAAERAAASKLAEAATALANACPSSDDMRLLIRVIGGVSKSAADAIAKTDNLDKLREKMAAEIAAWQASHAAGREGNG